MSAPPPRRPRTCLQAFKFLEHSLASTNYHPPHFYAALAGQPLGMPLKAPPGMWYESGLGTTRYVAGLGTAPLTLCALHTHMTPTLSLAACAALYRHTLCCIPALDPSRSLC